ncbi:MAG TPA: Scr1 family TA system antitoxin-like transcriptional regulator [Actinoplanes sp.]
MEVSTSPADIKATAGGGLCMEADADVQRYRANFQRLAAQALSPEDTGKIISDAAQAA